MNDLRTNGSICAETVPWSSKARRTGMCIFDDEIRERYGDRADAIIAELDKLGRTQKGKATRPAEARYRPDVDEWLKANGHG